MTIRYHPDFPNDIQRFAAEYRRISARLAERFRGEVEAAVAAVKTSPQSAGHFLNTGSRVVRECRRRNLRNFPFFILYGLTDDRLVFASLIPSRSDPLTWLLRLAPARSG